MQKHDSEKKGPAQIPKGELIVSEKTRRKDPMHSLAEFMSVPSRLRSCFFQNSPLGKSLLEANLLTAFVAKALKEGKKLADVQLALREYGTHDSWGQFLHDNSPNRDISVYFEIILDALSSKLKLSTDKSKLKEGQTLLYDFMKERLEASQFKAEAKQLF